MGYHEKKRAYHGLVNVSQHPRLAEEIRTKGEPVEFKKYREMIVHAIDKVTCDVEEIFKDAVEGAVGHIPGCEDIDTNEIVELNVSIPYEIADEIMKIIYRKGDYTYRLKDEHGEYMLVKGPGSSGSFIIILESDWAIWTIKDNFSYKDPSQKAGNILVRGDYGRISYQGADRDSDDSVIALAVPRHWYYQDCDDDEEDIDLSGSYMAIDRFGNLKGTAIQI